MRFRGNSAGNRSRTESGPGGIPGSAANGGRGPVGIRQLGPAVPGREMDVPGASSQTLTGEIGLSEFQNVFAEVSICPETTKLHPKSWRETHFEATVSRREFSVQFSRRSKSGPGGDPWLCSKWGQGPRGHPPTGVRGASLFAEMGEGAQLASRNWGPGAFLFCQKVCVGRLRKSCPDLDLQKCV